MFLYLLRLLFDGGLLILLTNRENLHCVLCVCNSTAHHRTIDRDKMLNAKFNVSTNAYIRFVYLTFFLKVKFMYANHISTKFVRSHKFFKVRPLFVSLYVVLLFTFSLCIVQTAICLEIHLE